MLMPCEMQILNLTTSVVYNPCSTILEEEKLQQEERLRMEMRRQVTVSWDSGGSDEAPPKVKLWDKALFVFQYFIFLFFNVGIEWKQIVIFPSTAQSTRLPQSSLQWGLLLQPPAQPLSSKERLCHSQTYLNSCKQFSLEINRIWFFIKLTS